MSSLFNFPWQQAFDSSGNTLAGAKLYFYTAGTSTPQNVYSDIGLGVALPNPVVANGAGRFPPIYMDDISYKVMLYTADDVLIWSADNVWAQSIDADAAVALAAVKAVGVSAGYTEEEATDATTFAKSIFKYANASTWYQDIGETDNVYVLEGMDDYTRPADYFEGFEVEFVSSRANTGAATVNVAELGAKNIYHADGSALNAGDIQGLVHLRFNGTSFVVVPAQVDQYGNQTIYNTKTFNESPIVPTPATSDNSTKAASTAYVRNAFTEKMYPNYAGQIVTAANTTSYTTPTAGWVQVRMYTGNGQTGYFYIDGKQVYCQNTAGDRSGVAYIESGLYFVPSGKTVSASYPNNDGRNAIVFYPERA